MQTIVSPRRPAIAALMSFALPGFGQFYNGEVNRAIWLFLAFTLLTGPGIATVALHSPGVSLLPLMAVNLGLALAIWLWGIVDAWRSAMHKPDYIPAGWQISGIYALILLTCDLIVLPGMASHVRDHQVASFSIAGPSMEPTLLRNDIVFADKRYNCLGCSAGVKRGDIAIFTYPNDRTLTYVKRIIALPGDRVRIAGNEIYVNARSLKSGETTTADGVLVTESLNGRQWQARWPAQAVADFSLTVPPGQVFVLGDNRKASRDSRAFGAVPLSDVAGRVRQVWFSSGRGGIRWGRLGLTVQ